jgi:ubiquinone/menaquinone biosynthesis C-methylase UbiE
VGTGLSFDDYDATTEIVGIDISEPMIARARERLVTGRYPFEKNWRSWMHRNWLTLMPLSIA